jgi:phosphoribosylglycinamide formyltransferase-1
VPGACRAIFKAVIPSGNQALGEGLSRGTSDQTSRAEAEVLGYATRKTRRFARDDGPRTRSGSEPRSPTVAVLVPCDLCNRRLAIRYNSCVSVARLAIMVGPKGRGSNMLAIARACASGELGASVATVIAPIESSPAVQTALQEALRVDIIPPGDDYGKRLLDVLCEVEADWICLAGFLRLLPTEVLDRFPRRVLNIHPALLPKYGGKGMYGVRVHEAVLNAGDMESGASVHYVTEHYDEGDVILQRSCPVLPGDTVESLAARVLKEEHLVYVEALKKVTGG